jgi:SPP1 family predicted phage head-tail adaptor
MIASELRDKVTFRRRAAVSDGYGNTEGDWADEFTVPARVWPRLGGEQVMAARLAGSQLASITVRQSTQTMQVTTDWMLRDDRKGTEYNIRSIVDPQAHTADRGRILDMLCESGKAV